MMFARDLQLVTWERDSVTSVTRLCNTVVTPRPAPACPRIIGPI